jgi:hypothetical protein
MTRQAFPEFGEKSIFGDIWGSKFHQITFWRYGFAANSADMTELIGPA